MGKKNSISISMKKPKNFEKALDIISKSLHSVPYAIRGTASLVLQGLDMNVDDIDIVCSKDVALKINEILKEYLVVPVSYKESVKFKSYFGEFNIEGVKVEVMGDWQIKKPNGEWSSIYNGSEHTLVTLGTATIPVTTVESELKMFSDMGRFTALKKIKSQL